MASQAPLNAGATGPLAALSEGRFRLPSGTDAYTCTWRATESAAKAGRPPVVLVHGFGEHCRRYDQVGAALAAAGFTVCALDLPGHGRSSGRRGDVGALAGVLRDIEAFFEAVLESEAAGDGFMFGHSMGAALAVAWATARPGRLRGLVLSAPAVHLVLRPALQVGLVRLLGRAWPLAPVARVDFRTISSQVEEQALYAKDPLVRPRTPACAALAMYDAGTMAFAGAPGIGVAVLVVHGAQDTLVPLMVSEKLEAALGSADKRLVTFAGCRHEVHHDRSRDDLMATVVEWLASRS